MRYVRAMILGTWLRLLLTIVLWGGYVGGFGFISEALGLHHAEVTISLVIASASLWGAWSGAGFALLGWFSFQVMVGFQLTGVLTLTSLIENGSIGRLAVFLAVGGSLQRFSE